MIPLTQPDIIAHETITPWPLATQVEQDLLLCRSMRAIFRDDFLSTQVAMRGGTLLHKVHLAPPSRYSEDIDLVVVGDRPEGHIKRSLRRVLEEVLGEPRRSQWAELLLAIRNAHRPSRILRMNYSVPSITAPGTSLEIQIETNVTERQSYQPVQKIPFGYAFRGEQVQLQISGYDIHEMLGTKLRALFQRDKGRDLFDLYWALTHAAPPVEPQRIIDAFNHYLRAEGTTAHRAEFEEALRGRLNRRGFRTDMEPLLRRDMRYDAEEAATLVQTQLLALLPQ